MDNAPIGLRWQLSDGFKHVSIIYMVVLNTKDVYRLLSIFSGMDTSAYITFDLTAQKIQGQVLKLYLGD